ncbi:hypothetical protein QAD02_005271 [Eretmocerus hayati]|uniref:Uncharacterized protein n=1 Tax=Eretmocerus hayati TaxID=131215 RepID=A0ACC2NSD9_9HYME|nr:hypothetical protein QAD02_005271 [Eretmocerus hayati]
MSYPSLLKVLQNTKSVRCYCVYHNHRLNDFPQTFQSKEAEPKWYHEWETNEFYQSNCHDGNTYKMVLPPPNVTGTLHLGHALTTTVQDVLARWHRMKGGSVMWIPGYDHAGIATQAVVEKYLFKKKGIKRTDISRDEFLNIVNQWKDEKITIIESQLKTLGATLDWRRTYFTMSQKHNQAVVEAFCTLDKRNLLYRDKTLVNWSVALGSTLSDIEVDNKLLEGKTDLEIPGYSKKVSFGQIFEISYDLKDSDDRLGVATTRPETILGDVALAVHPEDPRYSKYVGKHVKHPLKETYIPVIADTGVKIDFGTGIVKITPAHDNFDNLVAKKNQLGMIRVIGEDGKMTEEAGVYAGLPRFIARNKILDDLANQKSLIRTQDHKMQIPTCSRTGDIIELLPKEQWFIKCKDMASRACKAVEDGSLRINPDIHIETWYNWLNNIRDWCVSRQLWWGHQIPAYHCKVGDDVKWIVAQSKQEASEKIQKLYGSGTDLEQDTDVLDTWFSSALIPFSSMGWPVELDDFHKYYPLSLMETGHDILFFWVARMVMLGIELTGTLPFKDVLLHGVLCDAHGSKMSKSRGNVIFPENVINGISLDGLNKQTENSFESGLLNKTELKRTLKMNTKLFPNGMPECGTDALRFTLCCRNIKAPTVSFDIVECQQNKFFFNKIWQASRYAVLMTNDDPIVMPEKFSMIDEWILSRLAWTVATVNEALEEKAFHRATSAIKQFIYYEFCDYYVEGTKPGFKTEEKDIVTSHRYTLAKVLEVSLRVLAPITPYLCDDLYSLLSKKLSIFQFQDSLLTSSYPTKEELEVLRNVDLETKMEEVIQVILSIRALLGNLASNKRGEVEAHITVNNNLDLELYRESINVIKTVSKISEVQIYQENHYTRPQRSICDTFNSNCSVYLIMNDEDIYEHARLRIEKKKAVAQKKLEDLRKIMTSKKYNCDMPEEEKSKHVERMKSLEEELRRIPASA